jgi:hypothetical protein
MDSIISISEDILLDRKGAAVSWTQNNAQFCMPKVCIFQSSHVCLLMRLIPGIFCASVSTKSKDEKITCYHKHSVCAGWCHSCNRLCCGLAPRKKEPCGKAFVRTIRHCTHAKKCNCRMFSCTFFREMSFAMPSTRVAVSRLKVRSFTTLALEETMKGQSGSRDIALLLL